MPRASRVFLELAALTALALVLAWAPLFAIIFVDRSCAEDEIPAASLLWAKGLIESGPWIPIPALLTFGLYAWKKSRPQLEGRSLRRKILVIGGALALNAGLTFGLVIATLSLDPHWLFGHPLPIRS